MKYKTQFRLAVQVIAMWLFLSNIGEFIHNATLSLRVEFGDQTVGLYNIGYNTLLFNLGESMFVCILYLLIFFRPRLIVNLAIPSNKPYCPECGYQLTKPIPKHCSECGTALPNDLLGVVNTDSNPAPPSQDS